MSTSPKVVIVTARCSQTRQSFGIRFEEKGLGQWSADWAFAVTEDAAQREGYDRGMISGVFGFVGPTQAARDARVKAASNVAAANWVAGTRSVGHSRALGAVASGHWAEMLMACVEEDR